MSKAKKTESVTNEEASKIAVTTNLPTMMFPTFNDRNRWLLDTNRRMTIKFYAEVRDGIMNGDPDGHGSRTDPYTGHGIATDVSVKRNFRDTSVFLQEHGYKVAEQPDFPSYRFDRLYVAHRGVLNRNHEEVYKACGIEGYQAVKKEVPEKVLEKLVPNGQPIELPAAYTLAQEGDKWVLTFDGSLDTDARGEAEAKFEELAGKPAASLVKGMHGKSKIKVQNDENMYELTNKLIEFYDDVRWFGAVASTGNSCGNVKGPFQFGYGRSVDPLETVDNAITRMAITKIEDMDKKRQDMGRKEPTPYALYEFTGFYSPHLARPGRMGKLGLSPEDMRLFWTCLYNFGRFSGSSMRGRIDLLAAYVFVHDHPLGNAHDRALLGRVKATRKEDVEHPRDTADYVITVNDDDLPDGIQLVKFYERENPRTDVPQPRPAVTK